ncbi:hypothetical protein QQP08_020825 [Theobroma cacao]|nr:hypothetical protein QQP08_020825 [Theobroma cacao]
MMEILLRSSLSSSSPSSMLMKLSTRSSTSEAAKWGVPVSSSGEKDSISFIASSHSPRSNSTLARQNLRMAKSWLKLSYKGKDNQPLMPSIASWRS